MGRDTRDLRSRAARIRASASRDNLGSTLAFVIDLLWGRSYFEDALTVIEPKYSLRLIDEIAGSAGIQQDSVLLNRYRHAVL